MRFLRASSSAVVAFSSWIGVNITPLSGVLCNAIRHHTLIRYIRQLYPHASFEQRVRCVSSWGGSSPLPHCEYYFFCELARHVQVRSCRYFSCPLPSSVGGFVCVLSLAPVGKELKRPFGWRYTRNVSHEKLCAEALATLYLA